MYLVAGLGNPGPKYEGNRHNAGFLVVDVLAQRFGPAVFREKFRGLHARVAIAGEDVVLLKPQTFMNLSGDAVQQVMKFFKIPLEQVLVVHDELDLPFGGLRLKKGGGLAGHNGLRSIAQCCGGNDFLRLRFGVDRPRTGRVEGHVLTDFSGAEAPELEALFDRAADGVEAVVECGIEAAMNRFNVKPS